jgi:hypothetical protein
MFRAVGVDGGTFNNFGGVAITNVYNKTVINDTTITRVSFNGGHRRVFCDVTATVRQKARLPVWVNRVGLALRRRLPVFPGNGHLQGRSPCLKGANNGNSAHDLCPYCVSSLAARAVKSGDAQCTIRFRAWRRAW